MAIDLWGELPDVSALRTPVDVLREQAEILGQKTGNVLEARISQISDFGPALVYDFDVFAPLLKYSFTLLRISHPLEMYPLQVDWVCAPDQYHDEQTWKCHDEAKFEDALREIFGAKPTREILRALIAQSRSAGVQSAGLRMR